jgi:hypothetical protein
MGHRGQTHCINGHEFTSDNVYVDRGYRRCRACTLYSNKLWEVYKRKRGKRSKLRSQGIYRDPETGRRA